MKTHFLCALVACFLWAGERTLAQQSYLKWLAQVDKPYEQKMARFTNGDIVFGGSPVTGKTADQNGGVNLIKLDECGKTLWAMNYQWKQNYMKFKDIAINEAEEVFVYGSAYEGSDEFIFLLKVSKKGLPLGFRVYHGGAADNFTYNIQLKNNKIFAYGLLLDFNTSKRGFIAVFDEKLNYQWGKVFEPFESLSEFIITNDNGFLCRSGFYHVKLDAQGNLQWATTFQTTPGFYPIAGPVAVRDGYVFEAYENNIGIFYKLDENGKFLWKSKQFPATNHATDITLLNDGNLLAIYNTPGEGQNYPCQIVLAPEGNIVKQLKLSLDAPLQTASIYQSIGEDRTLNIIGNRDIQAAKSDNAGFLLQFSLDSLSGNCFQWAAFDSTTPSEALITFAPLTLDFFDLRMRPVEAGIAATVQQYAFVAKCTTSTDKLIKVDSLLACNTDWQVSLPSSDFLWEDEVLDNPRTLTRAGTYRAFNKDCAAPRTYEFNVTRASCVCNVFLPTAFSPNNDGQNDQLMLFSDCILQQVQYTIYNRWGNQVFNSNDSNDRWDGFIQQKPAESGIYVAMVTYRVRNDTDEVQEGRVVQNVLLVR